MLRIFAALGDETRLSLIAVLCVGGAVQFIRRDNAASLHAHQRLGMREVAGFILDDVDYAVLSDCAT